MAVGYATCVADSWYSLVNGSTEMGNGGGGRLVAGYSTAGGGADTYKNRVGLSFHEWPRDDDITRSEVLLRIKTRSAGSCWGKGGSPRLLIKRTASQTTVSENSQSGDCTVATAGGASSKYPGPTTTDVNMVEWSGNPANGTVVEINVTQLYEDWYAERGYGTFDDFTVVIFGYNETSAGDRLVFYSRDHDGAGINAGGSAPDLKVTYTTNQAPATPSISLTPSGRIAGSTFTYDFDFTDPNGEQCHQCYIQISTDATFASVTLWDSGWVTPTSATGGRATKTHTGTAPTRGVQYYWRVKVRDDDLAESGWSNGVATKLNALPTITGRDPG